MQTLTWNPAPTGQGDCTVDWLLTMSDSSMIDVTIFVTDFANSATKTIEIYTEDRTKAGIYDFTVTVEYTTNPAV